ncbi:MAG: hypothetical protein ACHREM_03965 [Polyangiales bacterium]
MWVPKGDGTLFRMRPPGFGEGVYFAKEAATQDDLHFPFMNFIVKRASWPDVHHWLNAIVADVHQLAAALGKIEFFWEHRKLVPGDILGLGRFVGSELEYILTVCRSLFDQLQEVLRALWNRITLLDPEQQRRKGELKKSFREMVMKGDSLMSVEEIGSVRRIPSPLASAYADAGAFLQVLRDLRDGVVHGGKEVPLVFVTDRGFGIPRNAPHFGRLPIWKPEHAFNENVVSLKPALAHIVMSALRACNVFAEALAGSIQFPEDIAPDHQVFIRSVHGPAMLRVQAVLHGGSPWWAAGA